MRPLILAVFLVACGGETEATGTTTPPDGGGACGDVTEHDVVIRAKVVEQDGTTPVAGAEVRLFEEAWHEPDKTFAAGITGPDGETEFTASRVVSVADCWGVMLDYSLIAQLGERTTSIQYNSSLFNAINSETYVADTTGFPLVLPP